MKEAREQEVAAMFLIAQTLSHTKFYWTGELLITGKHNALEVPTYKEARKQLKRVEDMYGKPSWAKIEYVDPSSASMWKRFLLWASQQ